MKAKIRKTGEVVDVICYNGYTERLSTDSVSYIDSNGREVARENLNFYWDFEPMEPAETTTNKGIDWEQRRYEIAKSAMNGILSDENEVGYACSEATYKDNEKHTIPIAVSRFAVACADALIDELKKEVNNERIS